MKSDASEPTLATYALALWRGKAIILLTAVLCAAGGLGISLLQKRTYQAQSSLQVGDPNTALALAGGGAPTAQTPLQLALSYATQVTRQQVVQNVQGELGNRLSAAQLRQAVTVSVDPNSALINIVARARTGTDAAAIANAFAHADATLTTAAVRHQYTVEAAGLSRKLPKSGHGVDPATRLAYLDQLARLQALASVAVPVQVNDDARIPSSPASPRPVRNTLAAFAFGILLGAILVFARRSLDHRLTQPSDLSYVLDYPVVGSVRPNALGNVGAKATAEPNGAAALEAPDQEAFRVLRQNVRFLATDPLGTILVTSAAAEEGKSTVAACLAAATAAAGHSTLLVDCDLRRPVLADRLGVSAKPGLTDYLISGATPPDIVTAVRALAPSVNGSAPATPATGADDPSLAFIAAGTQALRPAELFASKRFRTFLHEVSDAYDTVILDSAPLLSVADSLELIPAVDGILVCVRLRQTTRDQARAVQSTLERLPARPVGLVLTGVDEATGGYYGYYGYSKHSAEPQH